MAIWSRRRCHECGARVERGQVRCATCAPRARQELELHDRMLDIIQPDDQPRR